MSTLSPHIVALNARILRSLPYPWWLRLIDSRFTGRRDADAALAHASVGGGQPSSSLRQLQAGVVERCEHDLWATTRIAAVLMDRRREVVDAAKTLREQAEAIRMHLAEQPPVQEGAPTAQTEAHLSAEQLLGRRRREAESRIAPKRAKLAGIDARIDALAVERTEIDGRLQTLFEGLCARSRAVAALYERRAETQVRAYLRHAPVADPDRHPLNNRTPLTPPAWASAPNPWITETSEGA